ncbi:MAG: squalene--hopene cyclase [Planctomycetes bacterium]|nr:squalene--hopene cyclase [Planctomycetota bacterium]
MSIPEDKTPAARTPDDLLPPEVQPPVAPVAIPVAQPLIPQLISPQPFQPVALPSVVPVASVLVTQPDAAQPPTPASSAISVDQRLPTSQSAPVACAVPLAQPTKPSQAYAATRSQVSGPIASAPLTNQPVRNCRTPTTEKRPTSSKQNEKKDSDAPSVASSHRKLRQPSDAPRHTSAKTRRSITQTKQHLLRPEVTEPSRDPSRVPTPAPILQDADLIVNSIVNQVLGGMPSWLVSSMLHVLVVVLLNFLTLPSFSKDDTLFIEIAYSEEENLIGEELLDLPTLEMPVAEPVVLQQLPEVSDPLAAMPILDPSLLGEVAPAELQAPAIGMALSGREKGMRNALVGKYGGTKATESSVEGGLAWLARNQQRDGSWSLQGPYPEGSPVENQPAATAMALLAFQGAGNTHLAGEYQEQVARGWQSLLKRQKEDGDFYDGDVPNQHLYTHGQATIAVCELFGMTKDKAFRDSATRAVAFALQAQSPEGGWRYYPGQGSDTSVTGWYVMALQSAMMAGLEVPEKSLQRVRRFLDSVQLDDGSRYVYQPLQKPTPTMTAEALLCRQYLGWAREDARLVSGVEYILSHPVDPTENHDVYYWYYAAQLTHHMEGAAWDRWNNTMRVAVPKLQVTKGKERGSWDPKPDRWSHLGGRLYTTCFSIYSLEVYYRHLPIYTYRE